MVPDLVNPGKLDPVVYRTGYEELLVPKRTSWKQVGMMPGFVDIFLEEE